MKQYYETKLVAKFMEKEGVNLKQCYEIPIYRHESTGMNLKLYYETGSCRYCIINNCMEKTSKISSDERRRTVGAAEMADRLELGFVFAWSRSTPGQL
jgi:hypothetical protein